MYGMDGDPVGGEGLIDPLLDLVRGKIREGYQQDVGRGYPRSDKSNASLYNGLGLTAPGARLYNDAPSLMFYNLLLTFVEQLLFRAGIARI